MAKRKQHQQLQVSEDGVVSVSDIDARDTMPDCANPLCDRTAMPVTKGSRKPKIAYDGPVCTVCNEAHMATIRHIRKIGENAGMDTVAKYTNINKDKTSVFDLAENNNNLTEFIE
jgi:hypothetical protein